MRGNQARRSPPCPVSALQVSQEPALVIETSIKIQVRHGLSKYLETLVYLTDQSYQSSMIHRLKERRSVIDIM